MSIQQRNRLTGIENKHQRTEVVTRGGSDRKGQDGVGDQEVQTPECKINKPQGYIAQQREYSQYGTITINAE